MFFEEEKRAHSTSAWRRKECVLHRIGTMQGGSLLVSVHETERGTMLKSRVRHYHTRKCLKWPKYKNAANTLK